LAWFRKEKRGPKIQPKKVIPDDLWIKCDACGEILYKKELEKNLMVCPRCGHHYGIVSRSGGARMMEGIFSLMQMAKTSAYLGRMHEEGLPYISILVHPTTGGVTASYSMLGDINIAEPGALIGFAGPRVIKQTIRQDLPEGFQRAEFLLEHGMLDMVVLRSKMREHVIQLLHFMLD